MLTLGMILAEAAASQGKFVTWVPEYGSEMRGGSASCKVKIGDDPIISPFMEEVDVLIALHKEPLDHFADAVEEGGIIIVESQLVEDVPEYTGRKVFKVPAAEIAEKHKNPKSMSVAMAGAIIASSEILPFEAAAEALESYFNNKKLPVDVNKAVFADGYHYMKSLII